VQEPIGNLGNIEASGVDLDAQYRIDTGRFGKVSLNLRAAYLDRFAVDPTPGLPRDFAREYAGHYTTGTSLIPNANFSRWKALAVLNWNRGSWNAGWTLRYVGRYTVGHADLRYYNESACGYPPGCELNFGASVRHNVMAGYDIEPLNARIEAGIDNLTDRQPPLVYQSNSPDNNVDATTFDTVGRFYWTRISVRF
jgi:outer membrane receptor protein involved in Fe transport